MPGPSPVPAACRAPTLSPLPRNVAHVRYYLFALPLSITPQALNTGNLFSFQALLIISSFLPVNVSSTTYRKTRYLLTMKVEALYTYPIKALRAQSLDTAQLTKHGFAYERRFMLLEPKHDPETNTTTYRNIHVAHDPAGTLFFPAIRYPSTPEAKDGSIEVTFKPPKNTSKSEQSLTIPLEPDTEGLEEVEITMHKSPTKAYRMPAKYSDWFSSCFGYDVVLAYLGKNYRPVLMSTSNPTAAPAITTTGGGAGWLSSLASTATFLLPSSQKPESATADEITFSDCAPYLVVSSSSLAPLSARLADGAQADITKFRPNIVVSGAAEPFEEDFWAELSFHSSRSAGSRTEGAKEEDGTPVRLTCAHNCARCKSLNIDYETGEAGKGAEGRLLAVMQRDRRVDEGMKWSPVFGRYCFLRDGGGGGDGGVGLKVRVGDEVKVEGRNEGRTRFGESWSFFFLSLFSTAWLAEIVRGERAGSSLMRRLLTMSVAQIGRVSQQVRERPPGLGWAMGLLNHAGG